MKSLITSGPNVVSIFSSTLYHDTLRVSYSNLLELLGSVRNQNATLARAREREGYCILYQLS